MWKKKKESPHFDLLEIRHGNGQMIYTFAQQLVSNQLQSLKGIPQIPIIEMQYKKASQVQDGDFPPVSTLYPYLDQEYHLFS